MKIKNVMLVTFIIFLLLMGFGLYHKRTYKDFNTEAQPLSNFMVGLLSDDLLELQLNHMRENLDDSCIIVAVKCEAASNFLFNCTSQKVSVEHVFRGDDLKAGDIIEITRANSFIFMDDDMRMNGKPCINMGFVNEMIPGNTYLVFLDRKIETYDDTRLYIQSDEFFMAPVFCYSDIINTPCISEAEDQDTASYDAVKENEFFLMSQEAIDKMQVFKTELLSKYAY